jgi:hypothetical protein
VHYAAVESIEPYILAIGTRLMLDPAESVRDIVRATRDSLDSRDYDLYLCTCSFHLGTKAEIYLGSGFGVLYYYHYTAGSVS